MKFKTLVLARTGIFNGQKITKQHLSEMVKNFVYADGVPVCIGHFPQAKNPKLGCIKKLWIKDDLLCGKIALHPALFDAFESGFFDSWSIGSQKNIYGEYYLHHLAFLGEEPPAIKNLKKLTQEKLAILATDLEKEILYFTEKFEKKECIVMSNDMKKELERLEERVNQLESEIQIRDAQLQEMGQAILDEDMAMLEKAINQKIPKDAQSAARELAQNLTKRPEEIHLSDRSNTVKLLRTVFAALPPIVSTGRLNLGTNKSSPYSEKLQGGAI
ncbi:MAG: hypothetical protein ACRCVN_05105 [Spirochaetia bacterium]